MSKVMEVYENYQQLNREEAVKPLENKTIIRRKIEAFNLYQDGDEIILSLKFQYPA
jgi:2-C-methyl-D-erythritol 4-phosphate cytidylyltransferase